MHIETLKVFCDLVDLQSFSLAAERNFITQSAVSQQIRTLEEKFKRKLLERVRGRREVKLTPAGEVFHREAQNVLNGSAELGVLAFPEPRRGITIIYMPEHRLVLVCPPDNKFAKRSSVKTKDLNGVDFVHFERDTPTRKAIDKLLKS